MTQREKQKLKKFIKKNNINVLLVANHDWCALGEHYARSLRSIGVNATMFIRSRHRFNYPDQGTEFETDSQIIPHVKDARIIHFMHSQYSLPNISLVNKKVVVSHTGSAYRNKHARLNNVFNPIVNLSIVGSSLYGKGAKNEHWIPGGVADINLLQPIYERSSDKIIIAHFPSSPGLKGSKIIKSVFKTIRGNYEFNCSFEVINWKDNIERIKKCDVYVERFTQNTGFGISAIEAAALGKIVITTYAFEQKYKETIGEFGLISVKTQQELKEEIERIISLPDDKLLELKKKNREWAVKYHSYEAVGNRLLGLYRTIL